MLLRKDFRHFLISIFVFLLVASPVFYNFLTTPSDMPFFAEPSYFSFLRDPAVAKISLFPLLWNTGFLGLMSVVGFGMILALFIYMMMERYRESLIKDKDRKLIAVVLSSLLFLGINVLFGELIPVMLVIELMPARGLAFLYWVTLIYFGWFLWELFRRDYFNKLLSVFTVSALLRGVLYFVSGLGLFAAGLYVRGRFPYFFRNRVVKTVSIVVLLGLSFYIIAATIKPVDFPHTYPNHNQETMDWLCVQDWARQNTPIEAHFIVPPYLPNFRVFSERGAVISEWDDVSVMFSVEFAEEWDRRRMDVKGFESFGGDIEVYNNMSEEEFLGLSGKYNASHIVVSGEKELALPLAYENSHFRVYEAVLF
jgi:hypothetical protein